MALKQQDVRLVTAHGRPLTDLHPALHHGARLIVLGDGQTAAQLGPWLKTLGSVTAKSKP